MWETAECLFGVRLQEKIDVEPTQITGIAVLIGGILRVGCLAVLIGQ